MGDGGGGGWRDGREMEEVASEPDGDEFSARLTACAFCCAESATGTCVSPPAHFFIKSLKASTDLTLPCLPGGMVEVTVKLL